jgi:hypothetical protein
MTCRLILSPTTPIHHKTELPAQDFLTEEKVEEQKSELITQEFLTEERVEK